MAGRGTTGLLFHSSVESRQSNVEPEPSLPELEILPRSTILDGEIVALDDQRIPRLQLLQRWQKRPTVPVVYYLFDALWSEDHDFTSKAGPRAFYWFR
jgi:hypothetical protein